MQTSYHIKPAQTAQLQSMQAARPEAAAYRLRDIWIAAGYTSVNVRFNGIVEPSYDGCVPLQDRRASHRVIVPDGDTCLRLSKRQTALARRGGQDR